LKGISNIFIIFKNLKSFSNIVKILKEKVFNESNFDDFVNFEVV
jgi:hypothetical protein